MVIENTWPLATVIDSWDEEIDRPERVCFSGFPIYPNPQGQFHVISRSTLFPDREESVRVSIEFGLELLDGKHDTDIVKYEINGKKHISNPAPTTYDGTMFVPLGFISASFGVCINWDRTGQQGTIRLCD